MPWDFDKLQPHEFIDMWDGCNWRREQEENKWAYFTASMMSVHTTRPVSQADLLKPLREPVKKNSKTDDDTYLRERFKGVLG